MARSGEVPVAPTLAHAVATYRDELAARGLAENSLVAYGRDLTRYLDWATRRAIVRLDDVTAEDLRAFLAALLAGDELHRPLSASSASRTLTAVRGCHRFAVGAGLAAIDPARDVKGPATTAPIPRPLTPDQVRALLDAAGSDDPLGLRDQTIVHLLYNTAARVGELIGLDVGDVDVDTATVTLPDRGSGQRALPLQERAHAVLVAYLARGRPALAAADVAALVVNARGGRLTRQAAWQILGTVAYRAGMPDISPHDLRGSRAAHLLDAGVPVTQVQALLGHASASTTAAYGAAGKRGHEPIALP